jgi:hypothetical protein
MLQILRHIQKADFILNRRDLEPATVEILRQLSDLGLVDPGYEGDTSGSPYMWVKNGNGSRVLAYTTGIRGGPHYELSSAELAAWLEEQGPDRWWTVDGDPLLTGRMTFPCPARYLAAELQKLSRPLLVKAKTDDHAAKGQPMSKDQIDAVVERVGSDIHIIGEGAKPLWPDDRILYLCWKGSINEWLLQEDSEAAALFSDR